MKGLILFLSLMIMVSIAHSQQNIIFNSSFEDMIQCPDAGTTISYSSGWATYSGTPDYFNTCSSNSNYLIPNNGWGNQYPSSINCNAYAGLWAYYHPFSPNGREYIGRQLSTAMTIGQRYYASIKVSLADGSNCGINKIGILFSISANQPISVNNSPHIYSSSIIADTLNWITISGSFIADSAYQYIILGNFFDDNNTDTTILGPANAFGYTAYYFLDDICVSIDSTVCNPFTEICNTSILEKYLDDVIYIFPNPADKNITIKIKEDNAKNATIKIYNLLGKEVEKIFIVNDGMVV